jgi:hypothetical protein
VLSGKWFLERSVPAEKNATVGGFHHPQPGNSGRRRPRHARKLHPPVKEKTTTSKQHLFSTFLSFLIAARIQYNVQCSSVGGKGRKQSVSGSERNTILVTGVGTQHDSNATSLCNRILFAYGPQIFISGLNKLFLFLVFLGIMFVHA